MPTINPGPPGVAQELYYTMYPLYDWKARVYIWKYNARTHAIYNPLYDLTYRAGVSLCSMRVCEPFGPEQRKGAVALPCSAAGNLGQDV
ncbi:hypothetical protein ACLBOM_08715 [Escherichia coli]